MLFVPIGAEEDGSGHRPVVTIALIVMNIAWFLLLNVSPGGDSWRTEEAAAREEFETYWKAHPGLTPPESLTRLLTPEEMAEVLEDVKASAKDRRAEMSWLDELDKKELDRRARRLEEALASRPTEKYGYVPARPSAIGALTSLFTHAGIVHLGGNMLFLWATGPFVEAVLGPFAFLALYLVGGLAACFTFGAVANGSNIPLVGASGAIAAVMGALLVRKAGARIRFLFLPLIWIPRLRFFFAVPAFVVLPLWFAEQVAAAGVEPDAPVAWWAHIGGFVFGMGAAALLLVPLRRRRAAAVPRRPVPARSVPATGAPPARPRGERGRAWLRLAVVSGGAAGEVVVRRGSETLFRRSLAAVSPGALAVDETLGIAEGPLELRVELRSNGGPPRVATVLAVIKGGESHTLRVEARGAGLVADLG